VYYQIIAYVSEQGILLFEQGIGFRERGFIGANMPRRSCATDRRSFEGVGVPRTLFDLIEAKLLRTQEELTGAAARRRRVGRKSDE
jgi:hypothetical protein